MTENQSPVNITISLAKSLRKLLLPLSNSRYPGEATDSRRRRLYDCHPTANMNKCGFQMGSP